MASSGVVLVALACLAALYTAQAQNVTVVPGLPVSGSFYVQHVSPSLTTGAGGTGPGGGRRLLDFPGRSMLQYYPATNTTNTTYAEAVGTAAALNAVLATSSRRRLLQVAGLKIDYAAKKHPFTGSVTLVLEFPPTAANLRILTAAVTQQPTGAIVPPATFFNAEVAMSTAVAVSTTAFMPQAGGKVRAQLTFDMADNTLPALQLSFQYASNLPAPQPAFFFLFADIVVIVPDKGGFPTVKGLIDTLPV